MRTVKVGLMGVGYVDLYGWWSWAQRGGTKDYGAKSAIRRFEESKDDGE
jgi:hypothetical protein